VTARTLVAGWVLPADGSEATARTEADLIRGARRGESSALADLVRGHQPRIRGLLMRLCADPVLADDLAQEVFLRAVRGLVTFEGRSAFGTWLYRIAYNVYLNHRARTRQTLALSDDWHAETEAPEDGLSARRADLRRDLESAIAQLPDRYRVVVVLHYLHDVPYPEIAEILEVPLGTVKTHLHRAKRALRELMAESGAARGQLGDEPEGG
jgi:RNA polymerase sigma-70 factor (ECF subfamily)